MLLAKQALVSDHEAQKPVRPSTRSQMEKRASSLMSRSTPSPPDKLLSSTTMTTYLEAAGLTKILIVKTSALGDIVHTFPVLAYLKEKKFEVHWAVEKRNASLLEAHPHIDKLILIDSKKWNFGKFDTKYDLLFDLQGNTKSGIVTFLARAKKKIGFTLKSNAEWPNRLFLNETYTPFGENIRENYLSIVQQHFKDKTPYTFNGVTLRCNNPHPLPAGRNVILCPGARWENKCVRPSTLIRFMEKQPPCNVHILWGSPEEKKEAEKLLAIPNSQLLPKLSLPELQNLMSRSDLIVSMDSLPLHLAGTTNTPTFSFFGPTSETKYRPLGKQHQSIQGPCPYNITFDKRCPKLRTCKTGACIKEIHS